jgi:hypothetical protein
MNERSNRVISICIAYESGFGDGFAGMTKPNPYQPDSDEMTAFKYGFEEGTKRRAQQQTPKPPRNFQGRLNRYNCRLCAQHIITIDRDKGVTPFTINCRVTPGCKGTMYSEMYRVKEGKPTHEWRKPTPKEFVKASRAAREHFKMGGLDLYPIENQTNNCVATRNASEGEASDE